MSHPGPKFSIGQRVMLVGVNGKIYNNNHVITDLRYFNNGKGSDGNIHSGWGYALTNDPEPNTSGSYNLELYLRPMPDEDNDEYFERFMKKLNLPRKVPVIA